MSTPLSGSLRLSEAAPSAELAFLATVQGLRSDLPEKNLPAGSVALSVGLLYEQEPFGSDGRTEMPRVAVSFRFGDGASMSAGQTDAFPSSDRAFHSSLSSTCLRGEPDEDCSMPIHARLELVDGDTFPPVVVEWSATADVVVATCPDDEGPSGISFVLEGA